MDLNGNTVLVTGGATGIGLAIAEHFLAGGSQVIICGRRESALEEAREKHPALKIHVCDLQSPIERLSLREWTAREFPGLNVLVNNAGIQQRLKVDQDDFWVQAQNELEINLSAPLHLSALFLPMLRKARKPAILNVTSGLSFSPLAMVPVYSATKAALHSYTLSLRHQLAGTPVKVIEIIPPAVDTDLGGAGLHTFGVPLHEFSDFMRTGLLAGDNEIAYATAGKMSQASRQELDQIFARMNDGSRG
jgi:uncharacterized oxidoreductase